VITSIDWGQLALEVGALRTLPSGEETEASGTENARDALAIILGPTVFRSAVDVYVRRDRGAELARSVLWLLHPWAAMERCYSIFRESEDLAERRSAVELLRVVADRRALPWVSELIRDSDLEIQAWAIGLVDQLASAQLIAPEEAAAILASLTDHPNPRVQETVQFIREYLDEAE
jgi:hypothetical protein